MSTTDKASISDKMRERFLNMVAHITELEKELDGVRGLGIEAFGERNAKRSIESLEASVSRMKRVIEDAKDAIADLLLSVDDDDPRLRGGNRAGGSLSWILESALHICGAVIPDTDDDDDHHGDNLENLVSGSHFLFSDEEDLDQTDDHDHDHQANIMGGGDQTGDDQNRMSRVSEIAPEMEVKKTFLQWLEVEKTASDHKDGVIELGTRLSQMLLDFFFLVSNGGDIRGILGTFKAALEAKTRFRDGKNSLVVVDKFFKLLETGEEEVRKLKGESDDGKELESALIIGIAEKERFVDNFCEQILNVEAFLNRMLMSRHAIEDTVRAGLEECGAELNSVEQEVSKQKLLVPSSFKDEPENVTALRRRLKSKARELWSGFGSD